MTRHRILAMGMALATSCMAVTGIMAAQTANQSQSFSGPYKVAGTVVSKIDGHPLGQTRVILADTKGARVQSVITSDEGRFIFPSVPAGKFSVRSRRRRHPSSDSK